MNKLSQRHSALAVTLRDDWAVKLRDDWAHDVRWDGLQAVYNPGLQFLLIRGTCLVPTAVFGVQISKQHSGVLKRLQTLWS